LGNIHLAQVSTTFSIKEPWRVTPNYYIFLPQSIATTAVVALFQMTWIWNDLLFGMVLTRTGNARPVMVSLASMSGVSGGIIPYIMAGVIFTSLPTIILFILLRMHFISGMVLTTTGE